MMHSSTAMKTRRSRSPPGRHPRPSGDLVLPAGDGPVSRRKPYMNGPPVLPETRCHSRIRLFLGACAAVLAATTAMVAAPGIAHAAVCSNQTGTTNGHYYQMWSNGQGSACITVGSGGNQYSTNWSGIGDFVAGVGWQPGSNQTISFSGSK